MRGLLGEDVLHRPHLVLADARRDDHVVAGGELLQRLDHLLRLEPLAARAVAERELVAQVLDPPHPGRRARARPPRGACRPRSRARASAFFSGPTTGMSASRSFEISAGSMSRWIDGRAGRERGELAGDAVVEARADRDEHVAGVHGDVRPLRAVHPGPAEEERVRLGEGALAHQRRDDRQLADLGERAQLVAGVAVDRAAADVEHRLLGPGDPLGRLADLQRVHLARRPPAGQVDRVG